MANITRQSIFEQAAKKLRQEFEELTTVPHKTLKGTEAEELVRRFLNGHLPKRFSTGSGFVIDPRDKVSHQTDVIVYDAFNCPVYRASDIAGIFPSDNVAAVIEVKSSLGTKELEDAFLKIADIKSMAKHKTPVLRPERSQTLGCIFAFSTELKNETLLPRFSQCVRKYGIGHCVDILVILDSVVITLSWKLRGMEDWWPAFFEGSGGKRAEGSHIAARMNLTGEDSLDFFIRLLIAHLTFFRHITDHPGFDWTRSKSGGRYLMQYLTSITFEKDPDKRKEILLNYKKEIEAEFKQKD